MKTPKTSRRQFLQTSTLAAAGAITFPRFAYASILGANDGIRFAVIGCGGMGSGHLGSLVKRGDTDNIKVVAVSDVYQRRLTRAKGVCQGIEWRRRARTCDALPTGSRRYSRLPTCATS